MCIKAGKKSSIDLKFRLCWQALVYFFESMNLWKLDSLLRKKLTFGL